tara:strand:+ start:1566 stop:1859 length:294 start_codon:yes stop_codon:yes gene_type:complete
MTTQQHITEFFKKNPSEVRNLRVSGANLTYKAQIAAEMVDVLQAAMVNMGSKAKMSYRQAAKLARCIDLENETYGWDRTADEMAYFLINDKEMKAAA